MTVLIAWLAAGLVAAGAAAVLGFALVGHVRRLTAAVAQANRDLVAPVRALVRRLPAADAGRALVADPATDPVADSVARPEGRPGAGTDGRSAPWAGPEAGLGGRGGGTAAGGLEAGLPTAGDSLARRGRHRARR